LRALGLGLLALLLLGIWKYASQRELEPAHADWIARLEPLHAELPPVQPGDWLEQHDEPGQTFRQYLNSGPVTPRGERQRIYIQPIGQFSSGEREVVQLTAEFMRRYFQTEVVLHEVIPDSVIPEAARRIHPEWGVAQVLTSYILHDVLAPDLPDDAAACLALTSSDLWPGDGWNFVFGQASLRERVGVWSIARNGDADGEESEFRLCLRRTMQTATHETGHMFGIRHCTAWLCNMCGSNSRSESDSHPLRACPQCVTKLCWAAETDPIKRYEELAGFCTEQGFDEEADFFRRSIEALR